MLSRDSNVKRFLRDMKCVWDYGYFDVVSLNRAVLKTRLVAWSEVLREDLVKLLSNKYIFSFTRTLRFEACWHWIHEELEKKVRKIITSCVVTKILETFPEQSGM